MSFLGIIIIIIGFIIGGYGFILNNDQELLMERRFGNDELVNPAIYIVIGIVVALIGLIIYLKGKNKNK